LSEKGISTRVIQSLYETDSLDKNNKKMIGDLHGIQC